MKIQKTTQPDKPTKNFQDWVNYLLDIGVRFNPESNYNQKQTKQLTLTSR